MTGIDAGQCNAYDGGMLKHSSLVAFGLIALSAPLQAAERRYSINDFDEVRVVGSHIVDVRIGRGTAVSATGTAQALDSISVETQGRTLVIQTLQQGLSTWKPAPPGAVRVTVTVPQLKSVRLEGSGAINVAEVRGPQTGISLTGSGVVTVAHLSADRSFVRLAGSGRLALSGEAKNLDLNVKGPGDVAAEGLSVSDLKIQAAGSGRVVIKALRSADVKQNGATEITVTGTPACSVENLGTGSVSCGR